MKPKLYNGCKKNWKVYTREQLEKEAKKSGVSVAELLIIKASQKAR